MNEKRNVAAVCGSEVRIYGELSRNARRPLLEVLNFPHHGAARLFAEEYDEKQRQKS